MAVLCDERNTNVQHERIITDSRVQRPATDDNPKESVNLGGRDQSQLRDTCISQLPWQIKRPLVSAAVMENTVYDHSYDRRPLTASSEPRSAHSVRQASHVHEAAQAVMNDPRQRSNLHNQSLARAENHP